MESKKDFSLFSKARTKQSLAHTCKNDKILESTKTTDSINSTNQTIQNLDSNPCHTEALAEVSKDLESKRDFSPMAQNDKNLESKITHPAPTQFW